MITINLNKYIIIKMLKKLFVEHFFVVKQLLMV